MADQIISRAHFEKKGHAAGKAGAPLDSHNLNWHASALGDWNRGHAAGLAERAGGPQLHGAPAARAHVDARQKGAHV